MIDEAARKQFADEVKVTYAVEPFTSDWDRFNEMMTAHYAEATNFRTVFDSLDLDLQKFAAMEKNGRLHVVKARSYNGVLVGYSVDFMYAPPHCKHTLVAVNDLFYVTQTMRGRGVARYMREFVCERLKERGVKLLMAPERAHLPQTHLPKLGFRVMETVYAKVL
jgi:GNAT superfamily N-acetyltransferase